LRDIVSLLSDAEIMSVDELQILVCGCELSTDAGVEQRYFQSWLLRVLEDEQ
jgi:hypothetical protein